MGKTPKVTTVVQVLVKGDGQINCKHLRYRLTVQMAILSDLRTTVNKANVKTFRNAVEAIPTSIYRGPSRMQFNSIGGQTQNPSS